MNRSGVRRLVDSTKSRIKAANTPRDDVLSEVEYRKLLRLVDALDQLVARTSDSSTSRHTYADMELVATINAHRESLAPILHRLISDSALANRESRAINRWSYKKKLHSVSRKLVKGVQADILQLRELHTRIVEYVLPCHTLIQSVSLIHNVSDTTFVTGVDIGFGTRPGILHRTVAVPPPDYFESLDTFTPEPSTTLEVDAVSSQLDPIPTSSPIPPNSHSISSRLSSPRGCILILSMVATFIIFSCMTGLYFTLDYSHGYSMGDAFTVAAYIVAVGALVSTAAMARHWPSCRCWRGKHGGIDDNIRHQSPG